MSSETAAPEDSVVKLVCVSEGSRLRVRIQSPGYLSSANCQFPQKLRAEGRVFEVPARFVRLVTTRGRNFYSVTTKSEIRIANETATVSVLKIFEDEEAPTCLVCWTAPKEIVFAPCGHYHCCAECTAPLKRCPLCRENIDAALLRSQLQ
jgi:hypothetical protein